MRKKKLQLVNSNSVCYNSYMHSHTKKMIAPIIIVFLNLVYYTAFAVFFVKFGAPLLFKIIGIIVPVAVSAAFIWLLTERLNEIKGGEEDDLGKY